MVFEPLANIYSLVPFPIKRKSKFVTDTDVFSINQNDL